ncbi:MAG: GTPase ObgE [Streptococcaceae bacterium]|jgi:GTP-binding protein|nr:GTPase ObgE [Streptococcaceae bacterium]
MSTFIDSAKIIVKAGKGGDGMVAFRRVKYVPNGGPSGGDGGRGGDVILVVDEGLRTLLDFRYNRQFKAAAGENGKSKSMYGHAAKDSYIKVPPGTVVRELDTGKILGDLTENKQTLIVAKGGRGGSGNLRFASAKNPAPELAENGEPGQEKTIELELKILADVGLVGLPSVGKSTLLSVISAARPKVGAYHFTTITPNLGMVHVNDSQSFVAADMPGLIEGASAGAGLGIQFLRHIERTRVLLHVIDMSGSEDRNPYEDYLTIMFELKQYDLRLLERPQIIVANKMDMPNAEENLKDFKKKLLINKSTEEIPIFPISSLAKQGLTSLLNKTAELLEVTPEFPLYKEELKDDTVYYGFQTEKKHFEIRRLPDTSWELYGAEVEKLFAMTNFNHNETIKRFARQLKGMGVEKELRARGAKNGDIVRIGTFEFEFMD